MKQKTLFAVALLMGFTTIISCEEEKEMNFKRTQPSTSIERNETSTGTKAISNGFLKEKLIQRAYEAYATWYDVKLTPENTQVIDENTLHAWVDANEPNKHESINQKNKAALAEVVNQGSVHALLVTAPAGARFKQSVFILGRFTSILITDIIDIAVNEPRWIVVKKGLGFYGNGTLDPWGEISCDCTEEYIIIRPGEDYTQCGRCPDLGDL